MHALNSPVSTVPFVQGSGERRVKTPATDPSHPATLEPGEHGREPNASPRRVGRLARSAAGSCGGPEVLRGRCGVRSCSWSVTAPPRQGLALCRFACAIKINIY